MVRVIVGVGTLIAAALVACGESTPEVDTEATVEVPAAARIDAQATIQAGMAAGIQATAEAQPSPTAMPTNTLAPTATSRPTNTPVPTTTPRPTNTPVPTPLTGRIAFHSERDGNPEIYVMNADGSDVTQLTNHPQYDLHPAWSPDGRRIAFTSYRDEKMLVPQLQPTLALERGWPV